MADAVDAGAPLDAEHAVDTLPTALTIPARTSFRNADKHIDAVGKASHLDESGIVATIPVAVDEGLILFTTIFLDSINTSARGLTRIRSVRSLGEGLDNEIVADWVDLNDDSRRKIQKLLSGEVPQFAAAAAPGPQPLERHYDSSSYRHGLQHTGDISGAERPHYFEPAPLRGVGKPTTGTRFWGSIGVVAYVIAALVILAFFPVTRAIELQIWHSIEWGSSRIWYWMHNVNNVRLYNNT
mgnify:CR=1 FL=1